jgi:hypothetical protein
MVRFGHHPVEQHVVQKEIEVTRIIALAASLAAVAAFAIAVPSAGAADKPSLVDDVAARLGVSPDKLRDAFKAALDARIDAAVTAGRLTPEQAAKLKARIASAKGVGIGVRRGFLHRHKAFTGRIGARAKAPGPVASYLGMTRQQLLAELRSGKSLAQIATAKGKTAAGLQAAMLAPVKEALAKAVENDRLTQKRADEILARLTERVAKIVNRVPKKA